MLGGASARLQNQIAAWGNITCLLNHNMQKMNNFFVVKQKTQWLTWLLWGMWLGRKKGNLIVAIFWLLKQGRLMINFEAMKLLFF